MKESNITDNQSDASSIDIMNMLTPDATSKVNTLTDLWSLARMVKDVEGDPVWEVLYQMGCNPEPVENIGYNFDYKDFKGIYVPMRKTSGIIRFALPKLASASIKFREELNELVNMANTMVTESKFILIGDEVWLIYERHLSENEDYSAMTLHILDNLKSGADIFYKIY